MDAECNTNAAFNKMCLSNKKDFFACGRRKNGTEGMKAKIEKVNGRKEISRIGLGREGRHK